MKSESSTIEICEPPPALTLYVITEGLGCREIPCFQRLGLSLMLLFLFCFSSSLEVFAQPIVSLDAAYRSAVIRNETLTIARETLIQSEHEIKRKKSVIYPQLSADLEVLQRPEALRSGNFIVRSKSESRLTLKLTQQLYSGGRASSAFRSAGLGLKETQLQLALTREKLFLDIAFAYYEALKAKNGVEIEAKEVERLSEHRHSAEKQLEVGEVTRMVLLRADAELSDAKAKLIRAHNAIIKTKDQLALLARIEGDFQLSEPKAVTLDERLTPAWVATAQDQRIEMKQELISIDQADEGITFAKSNFLPMISLDLEYRRIDQSPRGSFLIQDDKLALLSFSIPLFEGFLRQNELAQARSKYRQSLLEKRKMADQITVDVRRAILDLASLSEELKHLKNRVRFAKEAYVLASKQFTVGLGTHIDVLDANATLLDAEHNYSNARYDREVALLRLKRESGLFRPLEVPEP